MPKLFLVGMWLCFVPFAVAQQPTPEQIQQWISDLDHPRYRVRDLASIQLQKAGAAAIPALKEPATRGSAESSDRALKILGALSEAPDASTEALARDMLRGLSEEKSVISHSARDLLQRRRLAYVTRLEQLGATLTRFNDRIMRIHLDEVTDMKLAAPMLREFPEIEYISATTKAFDDAAAKNLACMTHLQELYIFQSSLSDDGLKTIGQIKTLRRVPMGYTNVTDQGLSSLKNLSELEYLGLRGNKITDAGMKHITALKKLTGLHIGETKVTDTGITELKKLPRLKTLYLDQLTITDRSIPVFGMLKELEYITAVKSGITFEGRRRLKEMLPNLQIPEDERDYP